MPSLASEGRRRSNTLVFVALLSFVGILAPAVYHQQHQHHPVVRRQRNERVVLPRDDLLDGPHRAAHRPKHGAEDEDDGEVPSSSHDREGGGTDRRVGGSDAEEETRCDLAHGFPAANGEEVGPTRIIPPDEPWGEP